MREAIKDEEEIWRVHILMYICKFITHILAYNPSFSAEGLPPDVTSWHVTNRIKNQELHYYCKKITDIFSNQANYVDEWSYSIMTLCLQLM